jgi:hypothetical protein
VRGKVKGERDQFQRITSESGKSTTVRLKA